MLTNFLCYLKIENIWLLLFYVYQGEKIGDLIVGLTLFQVEKFTQRLGVVGTTQNYHFYFDALPKLTCYKRYE